MDKWEYRYVSFSGTSKDNVEATDRLNASGKDGWEGFALEDSGMWMKRRVQK